MMFSWDITWCSSDCDNLECFRNVKNMHDKARVYSTADFRDTGECPVKEIIKKGVDNKTEV